MGITIPLSVLTVRGVRRIGLGRIPHYRWLAALLVLALTVPAGLAAVSTVPAHLSRAIIAPDVNRALSYLAHDPQPGGVLTTRSLGAVIPGKTGRRTYMGNIFWSVPHPLRRDHKVRWLFYRHPIPLQAREFVLGTGARFVLAPCQVSTDLQRDLAPVLTAVHHFGCATVYTLRPRGQTV